MMEKQGFFEPWIAEKPPWVEEALEEFTLTTTNISTRDRLQK